MSITVDTTGFSRMCRELQKLSGKPYPEVVRQQVAATLSVAIKYTPSIAIQKAILGAQNKVRKKYNTYARGHAGGKDQYIGGRVFESAKGINPRISNSNGRFWWKEENGKFYHMGGAGEKRRWSNARWAAYQREEAERKLDLEEALKDVAAGVRRSRGLGKQSWMEGARDLGIESMLRSVPAYVAKALPANNRQYKNGSGTDESSGSVTLLTILNTSPIMASRSQGERILSRAIQTRLKAFETEVSKGVFDDIKTRAQRYPGLFVTH